MESNNLNQLSIDIPNYSGPLEVLLDLAKTQKVDLAEISITKLADQFLDYIKKNKNLNLETASEFLLMATWIAYLKSKLLLPEDEDDDFKALAKAVVVLLSSSMEQTMDGPKMPMGHIIRFSIHDHTKLVFDIQN